MKNIAILDLGGTISLKADNMSSEFYSEKGVTITSMIQELNIKDVHFHYKLICSKISHELHYQDFISIGNEIQSLANDSNINSIIISMGTNALEDLAYFISLIVKTEKNIIFTGSNFPQNSLSFDGKKNLFNAITLAKSNISHIGVTITMNDHVVSAKWASKLKAGVMNDFSHYGEGLLGYIINGSFHQRMLPTNKQTITSELSISNIKDLPEIHILYAHIGMSTHILNQIIEHKLADGIISAGYGKGYQTTKITSLLNKAVENGIPVIRCPRSGQAFSNIDLMHDKKNGFILAPSFTPQKASLLLAICMANNIDSMNMQRIFLEY